MDGVGRGVADFRSGLMVSIRAGSWRMVRISGRVMVGGRAVVVVTVVVVVKYAVGLLEGCCE